MNWPWRNRPKTPAPGIAGPHLKAAAPPSRPSPAAAPHHNHGARLLTSRFFEDGCVLVWDAAGTLTHHFEPPVDGSDFDWDDWLKGLPQ